MECLCCDQSNKMDQFEWIGTETEPNGQLLDYNFMIGIGNGSFFFLTIMLQQKSKKRTLN